MSTWGMSGPMPFPCPVWKMITVCPSTPRATVGQRSWPAILLALAEEGWATTLSYIRPAVGSKLSDSLVIQNMSKLPHSHQLSQWVRAYLTSPTDGQSLTYSRLCVKVTIKSHASLSPTIVPQLTEQALNKDFYFQTHINAHETRSTEIIAFLERVLLITTNHKNESSASCLHLQLSCLAYWMAQCLLMCCLDVV